ncbi:hypothetical protein [Halodurantibacterium flavum]|uniref:hypothetical protein n=1 Tax=Halodurantibacterium flavum TaxID=1382802 RepID=UPI0036F361A0
MDKEPAHRQGAPAQNRQKAGRRSTGRRARRRGSFSIWLISTTLFLAILVGVVVFAATERGLPAPGWVLEKVESRLDAGLPAGMAIRLGAAEVEIERGFTPRLLVRDLEVFLAETPTEPLARFSVIEARLSREDLLAGQFRPTVLRISGGHALLRRDEEGRFDLSLGGDGAFETPGSFAEVLQAVDTVFDMPALRGVQRIEADRLTLTLADARAGEIWQVSDGRVSLMQDDEAVALRLGVGLIGTWGTPASAEMSFVSRRDSPEAELSVRIEDVAAADVAAQSAALSWLSLVEAPISGELAARIDEAGEVVTLKGGLRLGAGALRPLDGMRPIAFDVAQLSLDYDPQARRIVFNDVVIDSPTLRMAAGGHAYLEEMEHGLPGVLLGQFRFSDVQIDPEEIFEEPVRFSEGAVDVRLRLDPFTATIGQVTLIEDGRRLMAEGEIGAEADGWRVALDLALNEITHDRLLALWPPGIVHGMRNWLVENVQTGLIYNVTAALRLAPGQETRLAVGYEFSDAEVRFLRTMPPILDGRGYATIENTSYVMVLDEGEVAAPQGGRIAVQDSVFRVADVTERPATADLDLRTESSITAALSFLDEPPFQFLTRANRPVDLVEGRATLEARMRIPLRRGVQPVDVDYHVTGTLHDVTSDRIVPGRQLVSESLRLEATPSRLQIGGPGRLEGVPFDVVFSQPLGPGTQTMPARVSGWAELSPRAVAAFVPALPQEMISGRGRASLEVELPRGGRPRLSLRSDLAGVGLRLDPVGWRLGEAATGTLDLDVTLAEVPQVDRLRINAPGLSAEGRIDLRAGGGLDALRLSRVRLGGWLDAPVVLRGQGTGNALTVEVAGGTLDLRGDGLPGFDAGSGSGGSSGGGGMQAGPLQARLDRVIVTDQISLTGVTGRFNPQTGMAGRFEGMLNGAVPVSGQIAPAMAPDGRLLGRNLIQVSANDAGAVVEAAGLFRGARGGALDLRLLPLGGGHFDGWLRAGQVNVHRAPALAQILGALSIVGLLEQLDGQGIVFDETSAEFRLTPDGIEIIRSAATGPSLGVTLQGVYRNATRSLDMQGVVSPVYLVNVVGSLISRPGEGLFGFNYGLSGPASAPRVSVNPLSLLAPGAVRDLLRPPQPSLSAPAVAQSNQSP